MFQEIPEMKIDDDTRRDLIKVLAAYINKQASKRDYAMAKELLWKLENKK